MSLSNNKSSSIQRPIVQEEAIYDDAPPAYSATADYIPPPIQQQQLQQQLPSQPSSSRITPPRVNSYPLAESSTTTFSRKESSGYHYNSSRGLLGNSLGYVNHELTKVTSKASQKTNNDATKAVLKYVGNFLQECDRKEKKSYEKERLRDLKDRERWEKFIGNRRSYCQLSQPHQEHAPHGGRRPRSLCIEGPRIQVPSIQPGPCVQAPQIHIEQPYIHQPYIHPPYIPCTNNPYKTTSCNRKN